MKRVDQNVAGRPKSEYASDYSRRDVAGMRAVLEWEDVASFLNALRHSVRSTLADPTAAFADDAMLLEEFADFVGEDDEMESGLPMLQADPDFRERLRGRLWRTFVQTQLRNGGGRH